MLRTRMAVLGGHLFFFFFFVFFVFFFVLFCFVLFLFFSKKSFLVPDFFFLKKN